MSSQQSGKQQQSQRGGGGGGYQGTGTKPDLDNHGNQGNPNHSEHRGYDRHFQGSQQDASNHANQLNPNNPAGSQRK